MRLESAGGETAWTESPSERVVPDRLLGTDSLRAGRAAQTRRLGVRGRSLEPCPWAAAKGGDDSIMPTQSRTHVVPTGARRSLARSSGTELSWITGLARSGVLAGLRLVATPRALVRLDLAPRGPAATARIRPVDPDWRIVARGGPGSPVLEGALRELVEYFSVERRSFSVPLDLDRAAALERWIGAARRSRIVEDRALLPMSAPEVARSESAARLEPEPSESSFWPVPAVLPKGDGESERLSRFDVEVWRDLLEIRHGETSSYLDVAVRLGRDSRAARAVGGAVGRNPLPIFVPCHRVLGKDARLTGFSCGLELKERLLELEGWEILGGRDSDGRPHRRRVACRTPSLPLPPGHSR
jgi:O-6-methylguanine DNA methyltransferase